MSNGRQELCLPTSSPLPGIPPWVLGAPASPGTWQGPAVTQAAPWRGLWGQQDPCRLCFHDLVYKVTNLILLTLTPEDYARAFSQDGRRKAETNPSALQDGACYSISIFLN